MSEFHNPSDIALNYTVFGEAMLVTFGELNHVSVQTLNLGIVQGVGLGAGILLLFMSWVIIVNKKNPIFILNQATLVLLVVNCALNLAYLLGPFSSLPFVFTRVFLDSQWYAYTTTVAANVVHMILIASVETTLVVQTYVIFRSPEVRSLGYILTAMAASLGVSTVGFYLNNVIRDAIILRRQLLNESYEVHGAWVSNMPLILFSASINVICALLVAKLVLAVRTRRYLGLKQFDSFHILAISSTQTFIVPSVLVIVNYRNAWSGSTLLANLSVIVAVLNLPLSSLWAVSANNSPQPSSCQNSLLSRHTSNASSQTMQSYSMFPNKVEKLHTPASLEKASTFYDNDEDSINRILDTIDDGFVGVTTHAMK